MSKRNKSYAGQASRALLLGQISRDEYRDVLLGRLLVDGRVILRRSWSKKLGHKWVIKRGLVRGDRHDQ